jgi:hypothetical protein
MDLTRVTFFPGAAPPRQASSNRFPLSPGIIKSALQSAGQEPLASVVSPARVTYRVYRTISIRRILFNADLL